MRSINRKYNKKFIAIKKRNPINLKWDFSAYKKMYRLRILNYQFLLSDLSFVQIRCFDKLMAKSSVFKFFLTSCKIYDTIIQNKDFV